MSTGAQGKLLIMADRGWMLDGEESRIKGGFGGFGFGGAVEGGGGNSHLVRGRLWWCPPPSQPPWPHRSDQPQSPGSATAGATCHQPAFGLVLVLDFQFYFQNCNSVPR